MYQKICNKFDYQLTLKLSITRFVTPQQIDDDCVW